VRVLRPFDPLSLCKKMLRSRHLLKGPAGRQATIISSITEQVCTEISAPARLGIAGGQSTTKARILGSPAKSNTTARSLPKNFFLSGVPSGAECNARGTLVPARSHAPPRLSILETTQAGSASFGRRPFIQGNHRVQQTAGFGVAPLKPQSFYEPAAQSASAN